MHRRQYGRKGRGETGSTAVAGRMFDAWKTPGWEYCHSYTIEALFMRGCLQMEHSSTEATHISPSPRNDRVSGNRKVDGSLCLSCLLHRTHETAQMIYGRGYELRKEVCVGLAFESRLGELPRWVVAWLTVGGRPWALDEREPWRIRPGKANA